MSLPVPAVRVLTTTPLFQLSFLRAALPFSLHFLGQCVISQDYSRSAQWIWSKGCVRLQHLSFPWSAASRRCWHRKSELRGSPMSWRGHREGTDAKMEPQTCWDSRGKFQTPVPHLSCTSSWSLMFLCCLLLKSILKAEAYCSKSLQCRCSSSVFSYLRFGLLSA